MHTTARQACRVCIFVFPTRSPSLESCASLCRGRSGNPLRAATPPRYFPRVIATPLPLFPLGLVLLPGTSAPLHIFEPRYRAMLRDVGATDQRFGLIAPPAGVTEAHLPIGRIGCVARIVSRESLPDERANIVVRGDERFRFDGYANTGTPYRTGHVSSWDDLADDEATTFAARAAATRLHELAMRATTASLTLRDTASPLPELAADPALLSFQVANILHMERDDLYLLLAERRVLTRLTMLETLLQHGLGQIEAGAELHVRAKTNGHHHGPPPA
jgi:Lon protease-like protein